VDAQNHPRDTAIWARVLRLCGFFNAGAIPDVKVAVIGSAGQLGTDVCQAFSDAGHNVITLSHSRIDVTDQDSVKKNPLGSSA